MVEMRLGREAGLDWCSRGSDQQVQRPWSRDLLDGPRNIVKASVLEWSREEERMGCSLQQHIH